MLQIIKTIGVAVANRSGAMEADTISKNGRSTKSQMSSTNSIINYMKNIGNLLVIFAVTFVIGFSLVACGDDKKEEEPVLGTCPWKKKEGNNTLVFTLSHGEWNEGSLLGDGLPATRLESFGTYDMITVSG